MVDVKLIRRPALAGIATPGRGGRQDGRPGVMIEMIDEFAAGQVIARKGKAAETLAVLSEYFAHEVSDAPRRVAHGQSCVFGTGPGRWRVIMRAEGAAQRLAALFSRLADVATAIEDGDGFFLLELSGPKMRQTLAKGVPVDLHPSVFPVASAVETQAALIPLHLALIDEAPVFECLSAASTAGSLWSWLSACAAEFGYEVGRK